VLSALYSYLGVSGVFFGGFGTGGFGGGVWGGRFVVSGGGERFGGERAGGTEDFVGFGEFGVAAFGVERGWLVVGEGEGGVVGLGDFGDVEC